MDVVHFWWLAKHLGGAALFAGLLGAAALREPAERQRAVYHLATPGLLLSWLAGYGVMRWRGLELSEPWIGLALLTSLGSLAAAAWAVEQDGRRGAGWVAVLLHLGTLAVMVVRPGMAS